MDKLLEKIGFFKDERKNRSKFIYYLFIESNLTHK